MNPIPIPDGWPERNLQPGELIRTVVVAAPDGDLTNPDIAPIEGMLRRHSEDGSPVMSFLWRLDDDDLVVLAAGGHLLLTFMSSGIPVHAMQVVGD
jgi:hypothetical protein